MRQRLVKDYRELDVHVVAVDFSMEYVSNTDATKVEDRC